MSQGPKQNPSMNSKHCTMQFRTRLGTIKLFAWAEDSNAIHCFGTASQVSL